MAVMSGAYESAGELARELTGGQKFMKYVIIGLAGLYLIFGIVLCATGSAALAGYAASIAGTTLPKGLIVVGAFLIFTSLVGGLSAWFEFRIGLGFYFVSMLVWTIILLAIGIAVLAVKNNLATYLASGWAIADCGTQQTIQNSFSCCGRYGQTDWYTYGNTGYQSNADPIYGFGSTTTGGSPTDATSWKYPTFPTLLCNGQAELGCPGPYQGGMGVWGWPLGAACTSTQQWQSTNTNCSTTASGCVAALQSSLSGYWQTAGGAGIAFAVIMGIGLAFTCFLMRGIQTKGQLTHQQLHHSLRCSVVHLSSIAPLLLPPLLTSPHPLLTLRCDRYQPGHREESAEDSERPRGQAKQRQRRNEDTRHRPVAHPSPALPHLPAAPPPDPPHRRLLSHPPQLPLRIPPLCLLWWGGVPRMLLGFVGRLCGACGALC